LAHEKLHLWLNGHLRTLWCYGIRKLLDQQYRFQLLIFRQLALGKPSSRKTSTTLPTTLAHIERSIVIEHIEETQTSDSTIACIFIFFNHQDKGNQTSWNLMIDILQQLIRQQNDVSTPVRQLYDKYHLRASLPSLNELLFLIEHEMKRFSKIWLIIDALDECPSHSGENTKEEFLRAIRQLPHTLNILITSRHRKDMTCGFDPVEEIEISMKDDDLENYVRRQVQKQSTYNQRLAEVELSEITASISRTAKGM